MKNKHIILLRFSGMGNGLVPMFLTENAPKRIRGALGVLHQLGITIGILMSQILGLEEIFGRNKSTCRRESFYLYYKVSLFILYSSISWLSCYPQKSSKGHPSWVQCYYRRKPEYPMKTWDVW